MPGETENQFFLTRAAPSTGGHAKSKFLSVILLPVLLAATVSTNAENTAPVLPTQDSFTIFQWELLAVTNTATDSDLPPNLLSYTLTVTNADGLVTNANISGDGVITWAPGEYYGPGVYTFLTTVTDNGAPPLSASNWFLVFVTVPRIEIWVHGTNGTNCDFILSWPEIPGYVSVLESKPGINGPWSPVLGATSPYCVSVPHGVGAIYFRVTYYPIEPDRFLFRKP
jgi:hypothetical protein